MKGDFVPMSIHEGVLEAMKYIFMRSTASSSPTSYLECPEFKSLSEYHEVIWLRYFLTSPKVNSGLNVGQIRSLSQSFLKAIQSSCYLASFRDTESNIKQSTYKIQTFLTSALDVHL